MLQGVFSLEGSYEVYLADKPAGKLLISREGLYYRLLCHCQVPEDAVYRLFAVTDYGRLNLGVVLPQENGCKLDRRIPVKELRTSSCFILSARSGGETGRFVPVYPEEPFSYISQLETAFLEVRGSQVGIGWKQNAGAE